MARINLLPWREERREERRKRFLLALTGVVVGSVGAVLIADQIISAAIARQVARNDYIGKQIAVVDERIKQISELKAHRQQLVERMRINTTRAWLPRRPKSHVALRRPFRKASQVSSAARFSSMYSYWS